MFEELDPDKKGMLSKDNIREGLKRALHDTQSKDFDEILDVMQADMD
jgi:Ca2+-binding EF-hand superfamily protein